MFCFHDINQTQFALQIVQLADFRNQHKSIRCLYYLYESKVETTTHLMFVLELKLSQ